MMLFDLTFNQSSHVAELVFNKRPHKLQLASKQKFPHVLFVSDY